MHGRIFGPWIEGGTKRRKFICREWYLCCGKFIRGGLVDASTREKTIFGEPRSKCGRRDAEDVNLRSADADKAKN